MDLNTAKESQGLMEARISKLKNELSIARLIDDSQLDISKALILSKVKIKNVNNGMEMEYTLVAGNEADLKLRKKVVQKQEQIKLYIKLTPIWPVMILKELYDEINEIKSRR